MNHLPPIEEGRWRLDYHARLVVYERGGPDGRGLLTIYDCGAAQKPPAAQLLGRLDAVEVPADVESTPTGRTVTLRDGGVLERRSPDRDVYRIVPTA